MFLFNYENHGHSRNPLWWVTALQAEGHNLNEKRPRLYNNSWGCSFCSSKPNAPEKATVSVSKHKSSWLLSERAKYLFPFSTLIGWGHTIWLALANFRVLNSCFLSFLLRSSAEMWRTVFCKSSQILYVWHYYWSREISWTGLFSRLQADL